MAIGGVRHKDPPDLARSGVHLEGVSVPGAQDEAFVAAGPEPSGGQTGQRRPIDIVDAGSTGSVGPPLVYSRQPIGESIGSTLKAMILDASREGDRDDERQPANARS